MSVGRGQHGRGGFTLIELLVSITIIAILAGVSLGTLFLSQNKARATNTRMLITKLHTQMMLRWESYETRRLPLKIQTGESPQQFAWRQLWAKRELMQFELPDWYGDIILGNGQIRDPKFLVDPSGGPLHPHERFIQRLRRLIDPTSTNPPMTTLKEVVDAVEETNQEAECLYMIITTGMEVDASGRKVFDERNVGDTDQDGMPEFIDSWGNPIRWIRWPAGFVSDLQPRVLLSGSTNVMTRDAANNHDPLDPRQIDDGSTDKSSWIPAGDGNGWLKTFSPLPTSGELPEPVNLPPERGYRLYPLIVSAGSDGEFALYGLKQDQINPINDASGFLDPYGYYKDPNGTKNRQRGEPVPDDVSNPETLTGGDLDNIHNQQLGGR